MRRVGFAGAMLLAVGCGGDLDFVVGDVEFSTAEGSLAPNLTLDDGRPVLSWLEPVGDDRYAMRVAVRNDGAWSLVGTPVEHDSLFVNWADFPSVTVLPEGPWVAHWLQKTAPATYAYHVMLSVSTDDGVTWGRPFVPHGDRSPTEHGFVAAVPWDRGAALVWLDGRNTRSGEGAPGHGAMTLRFTTLDAAGTPAPDLELDPRVCDCCQTDLARTDRGLVAVYRDRSEQEIRDIGVTRFDGETWTPPQRVADDGWYYPGCPVNGPAVAARGSVVVVAWFTGADDTPRVYASLSADGGATFGERIAIDDGRPSGRTDVVFVDDETAIVAWLEQVEDGAEIRLRPVRHDGQVGPSQTLVRTSAARASGFPRLVATPDGLVAAWTDPTARRVRVTSVAIQR